MPEDRVEGATVRVDDASPVRLTDADGERAGAVLAAAFGDDPLFTYVHPDATNRQRGGVLFPLLVRYFCLAGAGWAALDTKGEPVGVALWRHSLDGPPNQEFLRRSGLASADDLLGKAEATRLWQTTRAIEAVMEDLVPAPHLYLPLLGVDPRHRRRGLGSALVRRFLEDAAIQHLPACLWTVQPRSVGFLAGHGLSARATGIEPASGLRYWVFGRDPA